MLTHDCKVLWENYSLQTLREHSYISREGVSLMGLSDAAESIGFRTTGLRITLEQLEKMFPFLVFYIGIKTIL